MENGTSLHYHQNTDDIDDFFKYIWRNIFVVQALERFGLTTSPLPPSQKDGEQKFGHE